MWGITWFYMNHRHKRAPYTFFFVEQKYMSKSGNHRQKTPASCLAPKGYTGALQACACGPASEACKAPSAPGRHPRSDSEQG